MLNSTVELIALWASSSPSLLAFCFSHLIIAVLLLGGRGCASGLDADGRGDWNSEAARAEPLHGVQVQGGRKSDGGQEDAAAAMDVANSRGRGGEVDAAAVQLGAIEKKSGAEGESIVAAGASQERRAGDAEEDELMERAEEFIQRMNRAWRTENVSLC
ncbi:hypothetical protein SETIT_9G469200v2 [Setaria italica]|uniref:Uncharacterized protein n=1 Tax=Setaria italica TaxID=4555 RepID=K4AM39_SETIT|nr:uncharacterized protein LOC101764595 [Setaria italica]RCV45621.1 hypothetical protein SETIT_9G469200v2 [Setaria italica]